MLIGVFADVHGNLPAFEAVLKDGSERGVEKWFCLGDVAFRGPVPGECVKVVRSLGQDVMIMGNTEEWLPLNLPSHEGPTPQRQAAMREWHEWTLKHIAPEDLAWMRTLPRSRVLSYGSERLILVHATLRGLEDAVPPAAPDGVMKEAFKSDQYTVAVCAHIHVPYLRRVGRCTILNTGSVGRPLDGDPRASYVLIRLSEGITSVEFRRVAYDIDATVRLAVQRKFPQAEQYAEALRNGANF